jgi:hypothetical protein
LLVVVAENDEECFDVVVEWEMKLGQSIIANFVNVVKDNALHFWKMKTQKL